MEGAGPRQGERRLSGNTLIPAERSRRHGNPDGRKKHTRRCTRRLGARSRFTTCSQPTGRAWWNCSMRQSGCWSLRPIPRSPTRKSAPSRRRNRPRAWASWRRPRGTLTHHYVTDEKGIVTKANLIVGTTNNYAPISIAVKQAAQGLIKKGVTVTEGILNRVEMAFRLYDPCFGCATHALPGQMPLTIQVHDSAGEVIQVIRR